MSTTKYSLKNDAAVGGAINPTDWNAISNTIDNQLGGLTDMIAPNGAMSGWTITATGGDLTVALGEGWVGGAHCKTTGAQAITGITEDDTLYYVYAVRNSTSFTTNTVSFIANTTGTPPDNSILLATGTTDGDHSEFASVDNQPLLRAGFKSAVTGKVVVVADTGNANTEFAVPHNLGAVPTGYIVTKKDKACDVYTSTGGTAWTEENIYLKSSVANCAVSILVF